MHGASMQACIAAVKPSQPIFQLHTTDMLLLPPAVSMRLANITPAPVYPDRAQVLPDKMLTKTVFHVWAKMNSTLPGAALQTDQNLQVGRHAHVVQVTPEPCKPCTALCQPTCAPSSLLPCCCLRPGSWSHAAAAAAAAPRTTWTSSWPWAPTRPTPSCGAPRRSRTASTPSRRRAPSPPTSQSWWVAGLPAGL